MVPNEREAWGFSDGLASGNQFKHFRKKHPREYVSCFANLEKVRLLLSEGHTMGQLSLGFLGSEGEGLWRVGQSKVPHAKETRLYVFAEEETKTLHILGIGTKETQARDIKEAKETIRKAFKKKE